MTRGGRDCIHFAPLVYFSLVQLIYDEEMER